MNAKIVKLDELSPFFQDKDSLSQDLVSYFRLFGIRSILHRVGMNKSKGSSPYDLIILLSLFRICGESIFTFYRHGFYGLYHFGKTVSTVCKIPPKWTGADCCFPLPNHFSPLSESQARNQQRFLIFLFWMTPRWKRPVNAWNSSVVSSTIPVMRTSWDTNF